MSLPKEPRQQMINMMYLVLMALLAMNVSKTLLKAFGLVDESLNKSNLAQIEKINNAIADIRVTYERDSTKQSVKSIYLDATRIADMAKEVKADIADLKSTLVTMSGDYDDGSSFEGVPMLVDCKNTDYALQLLEVEGRGPVIRESLNKVRAEWMRAVASMVKLEYGKDPDSVILKKAGVKIMDELPEKIKVDGTDMAWHYQLVQGLPMAAVMPTLTQLESDILTSEIEILNYLKSKVGIDEIRVDRVAPLIIPESNYISPADNYIAKVFVSAWNSTQMPEIYIGTIKDEVKEIYADKDSVTGDILGYRKMIIYSDEKEAGKTAEKWPLMEESPKGLDSATVAAGSDKYALALSVDENGRGSYECSSGGIGMKSYEGAIFLDKPNGDTEVYLFDQNNGAQYQVAAKADPVVSAMAMNVMYVGVDNPVSVSVPGYKPEDIQPRIGGAGSVKKGKYEGKECFIARVTQPGKEIRVDLALKEKDGSSTTVKGPKFRVKRVPDPVATLGNKYKGGKVQAGVMRAQGGIIPKLENFDFKFRFRTTSYEMYYVPKGRDAILVQGKGQAFPANIKKYIKLAKPKDKFVFSEIKVKGDDGSSRKLGSLVIDVI